MSSHLIGKVSCKRYNTSLPPEIADKIRKIGKGNLSGGIRILLESYGQKRATPKPSIKDS